MSRGESKLWEVEDLVGGIAEAGRTRDRMKQMDKFRVVLRTRTVHTWNMKREKHHGGAIKVHHALGAPKN